ncbi:hypothetical protein ACF0H5_015911 [Mactra antiquata]
MSSTLADIQNIMLTKYNCFHLSVSSINDVYKDCKYLFARNGSSLFVTIKLPVSHMRVPLILYSVLSVPVPINSTSTHGTQILDLPKLFLMSDDHQYYSYFNEIDLSMCDGNNVMSCSQGIALVPVTSSSCVLSIFANEKDQVKSLCDFRFVQNVIKPSVVEVSSNQVLLYKTNYISMECQHQHKVIAGCDFCMFTVPCRCALSSNLQYFQPRLGSCHDNDQTTMLHPINLAILQHFFDKSLYEHIFADTTFRKAFNVSLPDLKLYNHKMSKVIANDAKAHLSLAKMAEIANNDGVIFQSLADPLFENQVEIENTMFDTKSIMIYSMMGVLSLLTMLCMWMFLKLRKVLAMLMVLQNVTSVKANPIEFNPFTQAPVRKFIKQQSDTTNSFEITDLHFDVFNFILLSSLVIIFILYFVRRHLLKSSSQLVLEVSNGTVCVIIQIFKLKLCPSQYDINSPFDINELRISKYCLQDKLSIKWPNFTIKNRVNNQITEVPSEMLIGKMNSFKLKKILRNEFVVHIYTSHCNQLNLVR